MLDRVKTVFVTLAHDQPSKFLSYKVDCCISTMAKKKREVKKREYEMLDRADIDRNFIVFFTISHSERKRFMFHFTMVFLFSRNVH